MFRFIDSSFQMSPIGWSRSAPSRGASFDFDLNSLCVTVTSPAALKPRDRYRTQ
jgi:hypothetical protein